MTAKLPFTQLQVRRLIAAAHREGLFVVGIRPDGTVITRREPPLAEPSLNGEASMPSKWEDVEA